jgi:hypothetical protein
VPGIGDVVASSNAHISGNVDVSGNVPLLLTSWQQRRQVSWEVLGSSPVRPGDLLGFAEIVKFLNVPERTAARYVKRPDFPDPLARLAAGPVWHRADVDKWAKRHLPLRGGGTHGRNG